MDPSPRCRCAAARRGSSRLQRLPLQDQLDLFGVQSFIQEQSLGQLFVLFGVRLQQRFGTFVRVLDAENKRQKLKRENGDSCPNAIDVHYDQSGTPPIKPDPPSAAL